jgi:hypothetical protein
MDSFGSLSLGTEKADRKILIAVDFVRLLLRCDNLKLTVRREPPFPAWRGHKPVEYDGFEYYNP